MSSRTKAGVRVWVSLPPKILRPGMNYKPQAVHGERQRRRRNAKLCTLSSLNGSRLIEAAEYSLSMTLYVDPRAAAKLDRTNVAQWFKADIDGVSDGIGVDDRHFKAPEIRFEKEPDEARRGAWIEVWAVQGED